LNKDDGDGGKDKSSMRLLGDDTYSALIEEISFFTERAEGDAGANFDTRACTFLKRDVFVHVSHKGTVGVKTKSPFASRR
jgi:hypothetical protein